MNFVIPPHPQASVAIHGSDDRFPVRRIFCVGRNYTAHVHEMGNDERDPPLYFTKPADAVVENGATIPYPPATTDFHHEIELVLAIGVGGANISVENAMECIQLLSCCLVLYGSTMHHGAIKFGVSSSDTYERKL
jgi:fumarylpyruvate hydrolase